MSSRKGLRVVAGGERPKRRSSATNRDIDAPAIVEALRTRIGSHALPPGSRLRESELAHEFGVSRSRIREAFLTLEERGLIERIPNRGAVVLKLDLAMVFHLYEVREQLEGLVTRLATERSDPASWQDIVDRFDQVRVEELQQGNIEEFAAAIDLLRLRTIEAAGNPVLAEMLDSIYEKVRRVMRIIMILPGRAPRGLQQHRALVAAMRRGDAVEAEAQKREIIRNGREMLRRFEQFVL
jgi:DNA-binding GntR family transcriptional regulator